MGGEHYISFHKDDCLCKLEDDIRPKDIAVDETDLAIWSTVKEHVLSFMKHMSHNNNEIDHYIKRVEYFQSPEDIRLAWDYRVEHILHDVSMLFMLAFPGKICGCFDRCVIFDDSITLRHVVYDKIPPFKLYNFTEDFRDILKIRSASMFDTIKDEIVIYGNLLEERHKCNSLNKLKDLLSRLELQNETIVKLFGYLEKIIGTNLKTSEIYNKYLDIQ
jgi:hypothetical protein